VNKENIMNTFRLFSLLAPFALALPLSAHAAMDSATHQTFIQNCMAAATQKLDAQAAEAHCTCGANSVNKHFSDAESIRSMMRKRHPIAN
jgi:hypothetical protein